jgi:hypothetical protein
MYNAVNGNEIECFFLIGAVFFNRSALMDFVYWRRARAEYLFVNMRRNVRLLDDIFEVLQAISLSVLITGTDRIRFAVHIEVVKGRWTVSKMVC